MKFMRILAVALFLPLVQPAIAQGSVVLGNDMAQILKKGELKVAITAVDQPPFYFTRKDGLLAGYDIDLANKMAEELGVKLVITREAPAFNDLVTLVSAGKADLAISKLSRTLTRSRSIKFSTPYMTFKQGILFNRLQLAKVASDSEVHKFVRNYKGTLGVIANSSYANYAKDNFPGATIKEYPTWDAAVQALTNGEVLSLYRDELEIKRVLSSIPNSSLLFKPIYFTDLTDPIAVAVKTENTQLLYWVNIFLENQPKMTADEVLKKYSGQ
ncbi:MAG: amino acid ABC transporter substrate-binding protein [Treponema sp.]|nr:amino acid ABC transporter substrate-binding protein [Treponema sp.]